MIRPVRRKVRGHWVTRYQLRSREGGRVLGTHRTARQAEKQELAIRLSQLRAEGRIPPRPSRRSRARVSR